MSDIKTQLKNFFGKCEEVENCKFIMATAKIKDVLKCIVSSPDLYALFDAVTKKFDYVFVKSKCLVTVNDGTFRRSYLVMPKTLGNRLAFTFCLLVEFDKGSIDFNAFLKTYFPEDGSYYASYHAFCGVVIKGMAEAVAQVYKEELQKPDPLPENPIEALNGADLAALVSSICIKISAEEQFIAQNPTIPQDEKEGGAAILNQLTAAVKAFNVPLINALICGYNYFIMYYNCVSDGVRGLIDDITLLESKI